MAFENGTETGLVRTGANVSVSVPREFDVAFAAAGATLRAVGHAGDFQFVCEDIRLGVEYSTLD
jgi:hypothetical protein